MTSVRERTPDRWTVGRQKLALVEREGLAELVAVLLAPIESARQGAPKRAKTKAKTAVPEVSPEEVSEQRLPNDEAEKTPAVPLLPTGTDGP